jgi:hypothetical protein
MTPDTEPPFRLLAADARTRENVWRFSTLAEVAAAFRIHCPDAEPWEVLWIFYRQHASDILGKGKRVSIVPAALVALEQAIRADERERVAQHFWPAGDHGGASGTARIAAHRWAAQVVRAMGSVPAGRRVREHFREQLSEGER